MAQESFKQLRNTVLGIGNDLEEAFSENKEAYLSLKEQYPDIEDSAIEELTINRLLYISKFSQKLGTI